ncbi:pilin subunit UpsB [Stygiolobus caldivivus]|uniref:Uncharacterized protein n=1 Tax=Stygiolobus caldivivus TaxID=2824673 RepID=A0A8D5ZKI2_9CREN|nr:archaellin/type IV pilin N-terminal domain-containing protein [Stygiolobus caldivivus]BCU71297.1 hypothetical protein KN1_25940 [Stygiolobus caldivivus]
MKAVTSIFSSLIVTLITLSLAVPLFLYFNTIYNNSRSELGSSYNALQNAMNTQITIIRASDNISDIYVYNYGKYNVTIEEVIIGNSTFITNYNLRPLGIVSLYNIIKTNSSNINDLFVDKNTSIVLRVNGNYYYYS